MQKHAGHSCQYVVVLTQPGVLVSTHAHTQQAGPTLSNSRKLAEASQTQLKSHLLWVIRYPVVKSFTFPSSGSPGVVALEMRTECGSGTGPASALWLMDAIVEWIFICHQTVGREVQLFVKQGEFYDNTVASSDWLSDSSSPLTDLNVKGNCIYSKYGP